MDVLDGIVASGGPVLLLNHLNSDPDAVGSSIALMEFLKTRDIDSTIGVVQGINALARNMIKKLKYKVSINPDLNNYRTLVVLDTSSKSQLLPLDVMSFNGDVYVIDHHYPDEDMKNLAKILYCDETFMSTSEIIYGLFKERGFTPSRNASLGLITGIVTDTGHLQFAKPETFRKIAELVEFAGMDYTEILSFIAIPTEPSRKVAHLKAASRLELVRLGEWIIALSYVSSFEASAARAITKIGADVAFVCSKKKDEARVSVRASHNFVKKTDIHFGREVMPKLASIVRGSGGGHIAAASVNGTFAGSEAELLQKCVGILEQRLNTPKDNVVEVPEEEHKVVASGEDSNDSENSNDSNDSSSLVNLDN